MKRRDFVKALLGTAVAATVLQKFDSIAAVLPEAVPAVPAAPGWAVAAETLQKGDIFSISGVFAINPRTYEVMPLLQKFIITADVESGADISAEGLICPRLVTDGVYKNVSNLPSDDARLLTGMSAYGLSQPHGCRIESA